MENLNHARSDTNHNNVKMDNANQDEIMHKEAQNSNRMQSNKDIKETKDGNHASNRKFKFLQIN